uniref:RNA exonuclease 4 n=1 Tax=Scleropages formosus TaxID=113540 RepID=A0A8C9S2G5_SCLFO
MPKTCCISTSTRFLSAKMPQQPSSPQVEKSKKAKKNKKKKRHLKNAKKKVSATPHNNDNVLPPKDSQQFSANWKTLQEALKLVASANNKNPAGDTADTEAGLGSAKQKVKVGGSGGRGAEGSVKRKTAAKAANGGPAARAPGRVPPPARSAQGHWPAQGTSLPPGKKSRPGGDSDCKPTEEDIWFDDVDPDDIEATVGAEAADIVRKRQGIKKPDAEATERALVRSGAFDGLTKAVAMDCEMVGVGPDGQDSIVARVSLVNQFGKCVYDKYVKPTERVTDYRTKVSGIRPKDIEHGENVEIVQKEVAEILKGRILVGHAIHNDLKILFLDHPKKKIRDTQKYKPFKTIVKSGRPSLKLLCEKILNIKVQQGEHSSVQDAQATMRLYTLVKKEWEKSIKEGHKNGDPEMLERKTRLPRNKSSG